MSKSVVYSIPLIDVAMTTANVQLLSTRDAQFHIVDAKQHIVT